MNFGGIVPGITLDRDVIALYGKGFFDKEYGHVGGRLYTNSALSATLIVEIGVDDYIETIWIKKGLDFPDSMLKNVKHFVSQHFELTNNGKLFVGLEASKEKIKATYGIPTEILENGNIWDYKPKLDTNMCYMDTSITFWFSDNKVTTIVISHGEE